MADFTIHWLACEKLGMDFIDVEVDAVVHGGSRHPQDAGIADGKWCEDCEIKNIDQLWQDLVDHCLTEEPESVNLQDGTIWWDGVQITKHKFHNIVSQSAQDWLNDKEFA